MKLSKKIKTITLISIFSTSCTQLYIYDYRNQVGIVITSHSHTSNLKQKIIKVYSESIPTKNKTLSDPLKGITSTDYMPIVSFYFSEKETFDLAHTVNDEIVISYNGYPYRTVIRSKASFKKLLKVAHNNPFKIDYEISNSHISTQGK